MPSIVLYTCAIMLFLGPLALPSGYYAVLRIVVTCVFIWGSGLFFNRREKLLPWLFLLVAIVFNPVVKLHLGKEIWIAVDIASGILLLVSGQRLLRSKNRS